MVRFRLLGIPVGVHATFLVVALLGASIYRGWDIAWWTVAAFASILLHELGHALTARGFGASDVSVTLYGLGGLTTYRHGREVGHGRSFVISAAGSFVGIVAGGLVLLAGRAGVFDGAADSIVVLVDSFVFTALVWGILNWIPVVPLDGGHMVQHLVAMFDEERAPIIGQIITWVTLAILAPIAWVNGYRFAVFILGFFALAGWREYRAEMERRDRAARTADDRPGGSAGVVVDGTVVSDESRPMPSSSAPEHGGGGPVEETPERTRPDHPDPPAFPI